MLDLIIENGRVVDPANGLDCVCDVGIAEGKIAAVGEGLAGCGSARVTYDAKGRLVMPGIVDMHTHMRTCEGHPHAQRMIAMAGVTTTLDMAGPLENILDSIPESGAGVNIAVLEAARAPLTISSSRPDAAERASLIERTLEHGGLGIKLLGGHFPMDLDISQAFIEECAERRAWVAWHAGSTVHGSNIEGMRDAVQASQGHFLHLAHINSYCRGQVRDEVDEAQEAIELLKAHPNVFAESYLSPLNGTRLTIDPATDRPMSKVTVTCLTRFGFEATRQGIKAAILAGKAGVLYDDGRIGRLIYGQEGVDYWESRGTSIVGSFAVNPAASRLLLAQAKRSDGSFVVDSFSTDGGCYPRNVIVENGLALVQFGALTLSEFVVKTSLNGARALGLSDKGHLSVGADADISIADLALRKAVSALVGGRFILRDGVLTGSGTTILCDARGRDYLTKRGIACAVVAPLEPKRITARFVPAAA